MLHLHKVVEEVLHAQVECDDEGEEEDLDGVLDDDRDVRLVPFEFFEKAHESAPTVGDALFNVLEGEFLRLIFLHYLLPMWGGTVMVTPLGAKRKIFLLICCMEPLSA